MHKKIEAKTFIEKLKSSKKLKKQFSLEISKIMEEKNLTYFYFASPPDEKPFLKEISSGITDKKFIGDNLLVDFLKKEFHNCKISWTILMILSRWLRWSCPISQICLSIRVLAHGG